MDVTGWIIAVVAIVGCLTTTGILIAKVAAGFAGMKTFVGTEVKKLKEEFSIDFKSLKKELDEETQTLRHEIAEVLKPIQAHIAIYEEKHYKLELYIRDNYIEVDTFRNALGEIKSDIKDLGIKIDDLSRRTASASDASKNSSHRA